MGHDKDIPNEVFSAIRESIYRYEKDVEYLIYECSKDCALQKKLMDTRIKTEILRAWMVDCAK